MGQTVWSRVSLRETNEHLVWGNSWGYSHIVYEVTMWCVRGSLTKHWQKTRVTWTVLAPGALKMTTQAWWLCLQMISDSCLMAAAVICTDKQTGKSYLEGWFTAALCNRQHTSSVMIFVTGDRELALGNLNHLPVGAQQLTGRSGANISSPATRTCCKYIEKGWHWATVHSHEDPAITCLFGCTF